MYRVIFSSDAQKDLIKLRKKAPNAIKKLISLLKELEEHPRTGTGRIEQLKHCSEETWSRRITSDDVIEVLVLSVYGHYEDL